MKRKTDIHHISPVKTDSKPQKSKKHAIFAISINKGAKFFVLVTIGFLCFVLLGTSALESLFSPQRTKFYEWSIGYFSNRQSTRLSLPRVSEPSLGDVLSSALPVFLPESEDLMAHAQNKTDEPLGGIAPKPKDSADDAEKKALVDEKTIVSKSLSLSNATSYKPDVNALVEAPTSYNATGTLPKVLILHTHGCETYSDKQGKGLGEGGAYRTANTDLNVTAVGEIVADELQKRGINVICDKTLCDFPEYNQSYKVALEVIDSYLQKYPSIEFVFDIHRDAVENSSGTPTKLLCTTEGKKCAQAMIVCGTDSMLTHPHWQENLVLALKIQNQMESDYPGLMRPINLREERFNMHKTKGSLIIEIGTHANTLEEAKQSAQYLASGIAKIIGG